MRLIQTSLLALLSLSGAAQDNTRMRVGPPVLGISYDAGQNALRPMMGVPGAATLGGVMPLGFPVASAAISPQQRFALAVSAVDLHVALIRFGAGDPNASALPGVMSAPDNMALSPSGKAAVLYQQSSGRVQAITGLPDNPVVQDRNAAGLPSAPTAFAISDDGAFILLASGDPTAPMWMLGADGTLAQLPVAGLNTAFQRNSHDALAATANGDIYLLRDAGSAGDITQLRAGDAQTSAPVAVQFAAGGQRAYLATATGALLVLDLPTRQANIIQCGCSPSGLQPLGADLFALTGISSGPLWLFDASGATPRTWFVPPDAPIANSPGGVQ